MYAEYLWTGTLKMPLYWPPPLKREAGRKATLGPEGEKGRKAPATPAKSCGRRHGKDLGSTCDKVHFLQRWGYLDEDAQFLAGARINALFNCRDIRHRAVYERCSMNWTCPLCLAFCVVCAQNFLEEPTLLRPENTGPSAEGLNEFASAKWWWSRNNSPGPD